MTVGTDSTHTLRYFRLQVIFSGRFLGTVFPEVYNESSSTVWQDKVRTKDNQCRGTGGLKPQSASPARSKVTSAGGNSHVVPFSWPNDLAVSPSPVGTPLSLRMGYGRGYAGLETSSTAILA